MSEESTKMELTLRTTQVLKQEAEEIGLKGKDIPDCVKRHQALNREDRGAWKNLQLAKLQAEDKKKLEMV